jgi:hypothetical protein
MCRASVTFGAKAGANFFRRSQLFRPLMRLFEVGPRRGNHTRFLAQSPLICVKAAPVIGGPIAGEYVSIFHNPVI